MDDAQQHESFFSVLNDDIEMTRLAGTEDSPGYEKPLTLFDAFRATVDRYLYF